MTNSGWVQSLAFSLNSTCLLAAGAAGHVLFDVETGDLITRFSAEQDIAYRVGVAFSPDGKIKIWDAADGGALLSLQIPGLRGGEYVSRLDFSFDGLSLFSGHIHGHALLWRLDGSAESERFEAHQQRVKSIRRTRDGRTLITASADGTVRLWDTTTHAITAILRAGTFGFRSLAVSEPTHGGASCRSLNFSCHEPLPTGM